MILLKPENSNKLIVVIGLGLIGNAILSRFKKLNCTIQDQQKVNWENSNFFKVDFLNWISCNLNPTIKNLDLVWSAGKSGFGSSVKECLLENTHFNNFLESLEELVSKASIELKIHLLSSAGALFEGQLGVDNFSQPNPKRPYGYAKIAQEQLLASKFPNSHSIYRPSSVYGPIQLGSRFGLISRMVSCVYQNSKITVFGGMSTLRDFIWVDDVAKPIVENVLLQPNNNRSIIFLVAAKPTSILEITRLIAKSTGKKVLFSFQSKIDFTSMSFSNQVKTNPTINLELGIELISLSRQ
ncbi:NAD-dependent epimerase/dehydratase family protein [Algoriphagus yeomjeoni]|uniref:Nucleoside-diphosphate-sugar epimerase n=1 Tax=Algoriphagus yeomjeoni TaxID=291403 RepID=A0A327NZT2_9BACT|nr:SDR family oxidoreductase [Algoriphagus yeomjeoni]RAI85579.1 nucleoside-diphosphate-sugar epimerase [Algoriphagus yeomjeoni]